MNNRYVRIAFSLLISAVFLALAAQGVEWDQALNALATADYPWIVPITAVTVWQFYVRAQRWRLLLRPLGAPPMRSIVSATFIGMMANFVLPLRAGEVIRPVLLSRREGLPMGSLLATCVLERIFDMFTILLLFGITAALLPVSDTVGEWGTRLMMLAAAVAGVIAFIRLQEERAMRWLRVALKPVPENARGGIERFFAGFIHALRVLDRPVDFLQLVAWSMLVWLTVALSFGMGIVMFHLDAPFPLSPIVVTAMVAVAVSAPSAPGFIGAFQFGCVLGLGFFGVPKSEAVAYSFAIHVTQFLAAIGTGLYALVREGLSLRQMEEVAQSDGNQA